MKAIFLQSNGKLAKKESTDVPDNIKTIYDRDQAWDLEYTKRVGWLRRKIAYFRLRQ